MMQRCARWQVSPDERCRLLVPQGHYKTTTVTAALRTTGLCALDRADGATNGQRFRDYVDNRLVPVLQPGNTVILDNLQAHKVSGIRERIEAVGARLRTAAARTVPGLWEAIRQAFTRFTPGACRKGLAAGYDNDLAVAT